MGKTLHRLKINNRLTLRVEESSDPEYPGIYVFATNLDDHGKEEEVACVHMEFNDNKLSTRAWDHDNIDCDPVTQAVLFTEEIMFVNVNIGVERKNQTVIDAIEKKFKDSSIHFDNDGGDNNTYNINAGFDSPKQAYDFADEIKESFDVYVETESFSSKEVQ